MATNVINAAARNMTNNNRKRIVKNSAKDIRTISKIPNIKPLISVSVYDIEWKYHQWTIEQFNKEIATIDCNPEWQRPDVDTLFHTSNVPSKAQSIIASILLGLDIGEIKLCYHHGKRASIDGGNRKRAIKAFIDGEFPLHKNSAWGQVYFSDLHQDIRDRFYAYKMRIIQYPEMCSNTIGELFRSTNMTTEVNDQEMLNSYGDNPVAVLIRTAVRFFPERGNTIHELFSESKATKASKKKDPEKRYMYLAFNNNRLRMEDQLVRILYRIVERNETPGPAINKNKKDLYEKYGPIWEKDPKEQKRVEKKLKEALDFFLKVASAARNDRKNGLPIGQYSMLVRLYFWMKKEYQGSFKVQDYDLFWKEFSRTFAKVSSIKTLIKVKDKKVKVKDKNGKTKLVDGDRTIGEAFKGYLAFDVPEDWKINDSLTWFLKEFKIDNVVTSLDPKRCFGSEKVEQILALQGWKDYIDGMPLSLDRAVGAHINAWSKGGQTVDANLVVVSEEHNRAMGTMNVEDYKRSLGY